MFGKNLEEKAQEAAREIGRNLGIRNINVKVEDETVTLSGEAPDLATKTRAMQEFNAKVETENTINRITIASATASASNPHEMGPPAAKPPFGTPITRTAGPTTPAATPTTGVAASARVHEVVKGDTLSAIAKKYYGKASEYPKIFEANRDVLKDPDKIFPGQKLRIPEQAKSGDTAKL